MSALLLDTITVRGGRPVYLFASLWRREGDAFAPASDLVGATITYKPSRRSWSKALTSSMATTARTGEFVLVTDGSPPDGTYDYVVDFDLGGETVSVEGRLVLSEESASEEGYDTADTLGDPSFRATVCFRDSDTDLVLDEQEPEDVVVETEDDVPLTLLRVKGIPISSLSTVPVTVGGETFDISIARVSPALASQRLAASSDAPAVTAGLPSRIPRDPRPHQSGT